MLRSSLSHLSEDFFLSCCSLAYFKCSESTSCTLSPALSCSATTSTKKAFSAFSESFLKSRLSQLLLLLILFCSWIISSFIVLKYNFILIFLKAPCPLVRPHGCTLMYCYNGSVLICQGISVYSTFFKLQVYP